MAITLKAKARNKDIKPNQIRREGLVPATVYGPEIEPESLTVDYREFSRVPFSEYNHIIELEKEGQDKFDVLIKNIQRNYVSREPLNIEFYKVKKGHKVSTKVTIEFIGDSEAVRMGADLVTMHKEVHVRCIPRKIPREVKVDLSVLKTTEDHVTYADLKLDDEVEILDPLNEIICRAETKKVDHSQAIAAEDAAAAAAPVAEATADAEAAKEA